jgi:predicted phosphoribosyltransferase
MGDRQYRDRRQAGRVLAGLLRQYRHEPDVVVLGLPRGGVPVAYEVATEIEAPLDTFVARKLGVPDHEELAMGAVASRGVVVVNDDVVASLGISPESLRLAIDRERQELVRREGLYRGDEPALDVTGRTVILVDDGLATGASMLAAIRALRAQEPRRVVAAVPTAPRVAGQSIAKVADDFVCAAYPSPFLAVGASYDDFSQTSDDEVRALLAASRET